MHASVTTTMAICCGEMDIGPILIGFSPNEEGKFFTSEPHRIIAKFLRKMDRPIVAKTMWICWLPRRKSGLIMLRSSSIPKANIKPMAISTASRNGMPRPT